MNGQAVVKKWGNSQGIRLSKNILAQAGIKTNDILDVEAMENRIVLKKAFRHRTFEERLAEYDGQIEIQDFDWGEPTRKEMF